MPCRFSYKHSIYELLFMRVRMKDIARDLGVSVVTISKVLRDHPDIGEETRERVMARVRELDYRPTKPLHWTRSCSHRSRHRVLQRCHRSLKRSCHSRSS
jgi:hypothetical protein